MLHDPIRPRRCYWQVFGLCFLTAALLFLPHCVIDAVTQGSFFHYAGDFNDQMIPFNAYANAFLKAGGTFSWATDLGSGFVNTYSYYCLGSPFFWLMLPLPARWVPFAIVPMMCLKFAVAGGGAYLWARRWLRAGEGRESYAMLAGCLYAFCGFNIYNIFFYFFLDMAALFPYLLKSLDDAVLDGQYGRFPFWVALNLLNNYFFFAGQAVFLIIYFVCMVAGRRYRLTKRLFGRLALETVLGCVMGCALLLPAGLSLLQNPRTIDPFNGYNYLFYGSSQQYGAIFYSALLMPDTPYLTDLFSGGVTKWTSLSAWLPLVGVAGGLAFCRRYRRHPFTKILKVCVVCAFVPVLNSMFYAFNSSYYARWLYMPLLVLCAATAHVLQSEATARVTLPPALGVVTAATLSSVAFALVPLEKDGEKTIGVVSYPIRYWAILGISLLSLGLFALLLKKRQKLAGRFVPALLAGVLGVTLVYGSVGLSIGKYGQWTNDADYFQQTWREAEEVNAALPGWEEAGFYRIDAYECHNNMGIWLDQSCIQHFNTTSAPHIMEFYPLLGIKRDVRSEPAFDLYALRGLLSVRFTLVPLDKEDAWLEQELQGWTRYAQTTSFAIYENENCLPMGFAYDSYMTAGELEKIPVKQRSNMLLKALVLPEEETEPYTPWLERLPDSARTTRTYPAYQQDVQARRDAAVTAFNATRTGFTAVTDYDAETFVLFSVPYDDGFSATVNGAETPVHNVDSGLMAVRVPAGHAEIEFVYRTPGLRASVIASLAALAVYLAYTAILLYIKKRKAR